MKILYFHQYFKTQKGSGGARSYIFAKHLVEKGHKVTMVYALSDKSGSILEGPYKNGLRRGNYEGINLIEFNLYYSNKMGFIKRSWIFIIYSLKSIKLAFTEDYDILFATSTPLTAGIPGIIMKIFRKKAFVFEVRDLWPELPREMGVIKNKFVLWLMGALEWWSYKAADACIGLSPGIVEGIIRKKRKGNFAMIPNSSDINLFKPGIKDKMEIPGCSTDDFVAIFTGAHGIANGLNDVIHAASHVKKYGCHHIKFVFVGDGMLKNKIMKDAQSMELTNCIFLDPVPRSKLIDYMQAADLGLMILDNVPAFYYGTSPNKFFDYLACGLPVFVNYPGWMSDLVLNNNCGITTPPGNSELFAKNLVELSKNKDKLNEMRKNSRKLAENEFSSALISDRFEKFLCSIYNLKQQKSNNNY